MNRTFLSIFSGFAALVLAAVGIAGFAASASRPAPTSQSVQKPCGSVTVAAASDLTDAMNEIASNFEKATGCTVRVSTGSSGNFLSQIENGAPFDVFFSADIAYRKNWRRKEGLAAPGTTYLYAVGKIVLWVRNDSTLDVSKGLEALRGPGVGKIAIANPMHAPYGRAARRRLCAKPAYATTRSGTSSSSAKIFRRRRRSLPNPETRAPEFWRFYFGRFAGDERERPLRAHSL